MSAPRLIAFAAFALILVACVRSPSTERFILSEDSTDGVYSFPLDMADSLVSYDIWLYSRIDARKHKPSSYEGVPLEITWVSPSGELYGEDLYFPAFTTDSGVRRSFFSRQIKSLYRSGVVPRESGLWTLKIKVGVETEGFRGLGVKLERNDHGAR